MAFFKKISVKEKPEEIPVEAIEESVKEEQPEEITGVLAQQDETIELAEPADSDIEYGQNRNKFVIPDEDFGPFLPYVKDKNITDVDYNGQDLWTIDIQNRKIKVSDENHPISKDFIERFARKVANAKSFDFNQRNPVMEAETKELRISIVHSSIAISGTSICIRKTPPFSRITERGAIETKYASREIISLLANCIKAHTNIVIAGMPRAGKTEFAKFLGCYIPDKERVITIEDVLEWRFKELKPKADCIEMQTNDTFTYTDAIVASLKQNPNWIMIAETRGAEIASLINGFSTGVNGITTLHTDDVRKIPQRMLNMVDDTNAEKRMLENIFEFVDVGVMVAIRQDPETGAMRRIIDQICFYTYEDGEMGCHMMVDGGKFVTHKLPASIERKFKIRQITGNYYQNAETDRRLYKQGYQFPKEEKITA